MSKRLDKKYCDQMVDQDVLYYWLVDFRSYVMEAMLEPNPDLETIIRQFKERMTKGGKRVNGFTATRMRQYTKEVMGSAYGVVCRR